MKFTLSWLKDHLDTTASVDEIAEALTDLGLEVEGIENPAAKLAEYKLGYVTHAEQHPDADRLRVCKVNTDEGELQIICGAPNAREGITVVVARPGVPRRRARPSAPWAAGAGAALARRPSDARRHRHPGRPGPAAPGPAALRR